MTGTGTEQDPYLVKTVNDFMSLDGKTGYAKLNNDIDFNDHPTYKNGVRYLFSADGLTLDGNKKQIRNLVVKDFSGSLTGSALRLKAMHDTYFVNMVCMNCGSSQNNYYIIEVKDTAANLHNSFNMMILNPQTFWVHIPKNMKECMLNISYKGSTNGLDFASVLIKNSTIHLDFETNHTQAGDFFSQFNLDSCIIEGKIRTTSTSTTLALVSGGTYVNCSFNFNLESKNPVSDTRMYSYPTFTGINIFNSDKIKFTSIPGISQIKYITDEQMKDNAYLQSIGFPVAPKLEG